MMIVPAGVKVHLALGYTDMRKGLDGLAMLVQQTLKQDPFSGHLFAFRGKKASMLKILFWVGNGLCLFTKRLDQGSFAWPVMAGFNGSSTLTPAQLAMLIEGIDWRAPERVWRPAPRAISLRQAHRQQPARSVAACLANLARSPGRIRRRNGLAIAASSECPSPIKQRC
jgi:transposase